jgi:hypothetical protein
MAHDRLEVVLHQPLLDQRALNEGAPGCITRSTMSERVAAASLVIGSSYSAGL